MPIQPGDVKKTLACVDELINDFGYKPDTPVKVGIDKFIEWFLDYYKKKNLKLKHDSYRLKKTVKLNYRRARPNFMKIVL